MFVEVGLSRRELDSERGRRTIFAVYWWWQREADVLFCVRCVVGQ
jgi:hypothetical protein